MIIRTTAAERYDSMEPTHGTAGKGFGFGKTAQASILPEMCSGLRRSWSVFLLCSVSGPNGDAAALSGLFGDLGKMPEEKQLTELLSRRYHIESFMANSQGLFGVMQKTVGRSLWEEY